MSKIIQKEKERQEEIITNIKFYDENDEDRDNDWFMCVTQWDNFKDCHEQSLINLKEYMEEEFRKFEKLQSMIKTWHVHINEEGLLCSEIDRVFIKETQKDIEELTKMIERY